MFIYRPHRGGLKEAMEEKRIFDTKEDMFNYIVKEHDSLISFDDLSLSEILGDDNRIGWKDCRYVLTRRYGKENYSIPQAIGHCSEKWE